MDHILSIQLKRVRRLLENRGLKLTITDAASTEICERGFDPAFGARPLKRAITTYLMNPMSKAIVGGGYAEGDTIAVDIEGEGDAKSLSFSCIKGPEPSEDAHDETKLLSSSEP